MTNGASWPGGRLGPAASRVGRSRGQRTVVRLAAIGLVAASVAAASAGTSALARPVSGPSSPGQPTEAADLGDLPRTVPEVGQAIKSFEKRDIDACLKQLAAAVQAHPELPPPHALLAKVATLKGQPALVRPALERAITEDRQHPEVFLLFGNLALMEGRTTDGAVHFEKARGLAAAKRWDATQRKRFDRLCCQGEAVVAEARGDWEAARTALIAWLEQDPTNARARERLGRALFGLGQYKTAYDELTKAAQADASIDPAAITLMWLYARSGDPRKAAEWMEYAVKNAPDSVRARIGIAGWLLEQGRSEEARIHVEAAAKLDPRSDQVRRMVGLAARQRKDPAAAEKAFQSLEQESPGDSWLRNQLALALAEQDDPARRRRALELAELSVRQDPNSIEALTTLGIVCYRNHRLDDASQILQAVYGSGRASSDALYFLALTRSEQGRLEGLSSLLKASLDAPGVFVFRDEARRWLDRLTATSK